MAIPVRPTYSTQPTATTIVSLTSCSSDIYSNATTLTTITVPDIGSSPSKGDIKANKLEVLTEVQEETESSVRMDERYAEEAPRRSSMDLSRGPSVRDRASQWEQGSGPSSTTPISERRPLPFPAPGGPVEMGRTRSTSPLRINRKTSSNITPTQIRRVPVPATAPIEHLSTQRRTFEFESAHSTPVSTSRLPSITPELKRGSGSAKKMIQQWENLPSTPSSSRPRFAPGSAPMVTRVLSREYLDQKPLPIPRANPVPASSAGYTSSPGPSRTYNHNNVHNYNQNQLSPIATRSTYAPSPLQHLQTPTGQNRKRASTLSPSPSSYSLSPSPSGDKRKKYGGGRSPLKEMLNKFGGGIQALGRKAKGKNKEKQYGFGASRSDSSSFGFTDEFPSDERVGTNGLPGGIVFSDRMGEEEMSNKGSPDPNVVRTSATMYLIPTPCSSVASWGSWLSSWATLTPTTMHITYCPIFQNPQSGHSTPRRVLSGTSPLQTSAPAVPFSQITQPESRVTPDVEMAMKDCVEVRSLRRDEVRGRGIPPVPEGVGTEVLEMVWSDGSKRYIGVEGVAGRLGWVSAIWDVILACKSAQSPVLPPPSPMFPPTNLSRNATTTLTSLDAPRRGSDTSMPNFRSRLNALEARSPAIETRSHVPPVQKVGDEWVAESSLDVPTSDLSPLGKAKAVGPYPTALPQQTGLAGRGGNTIGLRDSVQRMFDMGPDIDLDLGFSHSQKRPSTDTPSKPLKSQTSELSVSERIKAWQPASSSSHGHENGSAPSFTRTNTNRSIDSNTDAKMMSPGFGDANGTVFPKSETMLSFDPADLNPSRSASQVRRPGLESGAAYNGEDKTRRYGYVGVGAGGKELMPTLEERSSDGHGAYEESLLAKPQTYISHVTFPKPAIGRLPMTAHPSLTPSLPTVQSASGGGSDSSCDTRPSTEMQTPRTRPTSITTLGSEDPTVAAKLAVQSNEHGILARQLDGVQYDLNRIITSLGGLVQQSKEATDFPHEIIVPKVLDDKLNTLQLDVKSIENAIQLSQLAASRQNANQVETMNETNMVEVHQKLDSIARLCEQVLTKQGGLAVPATLITSENVGNSGMDIDSTAGKGMPKPAASTLSVSPSQEEKRAGEEVAQIMADLTGGSSKNSPRLVGLHVLHNISAPSSPQPSVTTSIKPPVSPASVSGETKLPEDVTRQVGEVLGLVTELKEARTLQTQQTTDIARYLNELNSWLEKFVHNSSSEITSMSKRLNILVGSAADDTTSESLSNAGTNADGTAGGGQVGLTDLVADMHSMVSEQKRRNDSEGLVGQRVDALLSMMGEERERQAGQQSTVEQVVSILDRQRHDNEMLLRAVATDLTTEIRGERMRFIEAMQQATSVNVSMHVEEFKKLLSTEVNRSMAELGQMREEKKALEQQISDLFALMAKHGGGKKGNQTGLGLRNTPGLAAGMGATPSVAGVSPQFYPRGLPAPPQ